MAEQWGKEHGGTPGYCNLHQHGILSTCDDCEAEKDEEERKQEVVRLLQENKLYLRDMRVTVFADYKCLPVDGDEPDGIDDSWETIQQDIENVLSHHLDFMRRQGWKVIFEEWEAPPEEADEWIARQHGRKS